MKNLINLSVLACALIGGTLSSSAQDAVPPPTPDYQPLSDQQLDQLLGPIALYPDPLTAQILPASTLPTQIVLADRYITSGGDTNQLDQQPWDASVRGLAHYPAVLKWMDDNLNWTTELGQAFLNQQQDVMSSIQRLRSSAQNLGNLQSTPQQQVVVDQTYIEIIPTDPQIIYVPIYDPTVVYYQQPFGPPFITFGFGCAVGLWLNCDFDWGHRNIVVWSHSHPRPPNWWHEPPRERQTAFANNNTRVWHPTTRPSSVGGMRGDRGWNNNPAVRRPTPINAHPNQPGNNQGGHFNNPGGNPNNDNHGNNFHPANPAGNNNPNNPPSHNNGGPAIHDNTPTHVAPAAPVQRFTPATPAPRPPVSSSANSGAFIGIQSSHDTRDFSNRGQQSIEATRPAAPVEHSSPPAAAAPPRSSPPSNSGGGGGSSGGGGGHSSSGEGRH